MKKLIGQIRLLNQHNQRIFQRLTALETSHHSILDRVSFLENSQYNDFQGFEMVSPYDTMSPVHYSSERTSPTTSMDDMGTSLILSSTVPTYIPMVTVSSKPLSPTATTSTTVFTAPSSVNSNTYMSSIISAKENDPLPSIDYEEMLSPHVVVDKYPKLLQASKLPTLAVRLAKQAYFGKQIMKRCTVRGTGKLHALLPNELANMKEFLKKLEMPSITSSFVEFENLWKNCTESIGQACKDYRLFPSLK